MAATTIIASSLLTMVSGARHERTKMPYLRNEDILRSLKGAGGEGDGASRQQNQHNWMSINEDVEFLPMLDHHHGSIRRRRSLQEQNGDEASSTGSHSDTNPYGTEPFVDGMSEYDEHAQAWRMIGFMIDCGATQSSEEQSGGSNDETTGAGCSRNLIWAAYVDLEYEGNEIAEYQYYDPSTNSWDDTACTYGEGSRCAKMDCHLEDTSFALLGFFKHRSYDDWMEQLFKHEGICVWDDDRYEFMQNTREAWPTGCTATSGSYSAETLYYDLKPSASGRMDFGLYTDEKCLQEYETSSGEEMEDIIGNLLLERGGSHDSGDDDGQDDYSDESLSDSVDRWNEAFDVWKVCHPCVAYDLENTDGSKYTGGGCSDDDGGNYNGYYYYGRDRRRLGGEYCPEGDKFECYDDAGYTNVNQCMKFSAKTVMRTATFRDLSAGNMQGTLSQNPLSGYIDQRQQYQNAILGNVFTYLLLFTAIAAVCVAVRKLDKVLKKYRVVAKLQGRDNQTAEERRESLLSYQ